MYCCFVNVFGENKSRLHHYTVFVQFISKKPLGFGENGQKAMVRYTKLVI